MRIWGHRLLQQCNTITQIYLTPIVLLYMVCVPSAALWSTEVLLNVLYQWIKMEIEAELWLQTAVRFFGPDSRSAWGEPLCVVSPELSWCTNNGKQDLREIIEELFFHAYLFLRTGRPDGGRLGCEDRSALFLQPRAGVSPKPTRNMRLVHVTMAPFNCCRCVSADLLCPW